MYLTLPGYPLSWQNSDHIDSLTSSLTDHWFRGHWLSNWPVGQRSLTDHWVKGYWLTNWPLVKGQ